MNIIHTEHAPAAIGPYSQGYVANGFLFTAGQGSVDPVTSKVVDGGIKEQADRVMKNLQAIAEAAGTDLLHTVKATCFLADMTDFPAFNAVYDAYFTGKPARSCIAVKELPLGMLCEVEIIVSLER